MLPTGYRLTKDKEFQKVFKNGKSFYLPEIGAKFAANNLAVSRFGFSVSLKVSKKAVERNRLKRRLREIVRLRIDKIKPGFDFVLVACPGAVDLNFEQLVKKIDFIFQKLGAWQ